MRMMTLFCLIACIASSLVLDAAPTRRVRLGQSATVQDELTTLIPVPRQYKNGTVKSGDWTWVTTVTTNDNSTITAISTGTNEKTKATKTLCLMWNNTNVPLKWRETFLTLSEEEKSMALSVMPFTGSTEVKPKEYVERTGDNNLTAEIYEIEIRED